MAARKPDYDAVIPTPVGRLGLRLDGGALAALEVVSPRVRLRAPTSAPARAVQRELEAYFSDANHRFRLPLALDGTRFQRRVWRALQRIPAGETRTYGELARALGSGPRAVGGACRENPVPIVVPCHRVVAKGHVGGYMGETGGRCINIKAWLLAHER